MATDPVCGMTVDENKAAAKVEYKGNTYYFCSMHCQKAFTADPPKYVPGAGSGESGHGSAHHRH